ncbi:hypothetical protein BASA81_000245 [Batrachochytrium salamandrivorans]|nr:hypothetical protein BASA81_000245 [Batrachochytrium salamandrivorans]
MPSLWFAIASAATALGALAVVRLRKPKHLVDLVRQSCRTTSEELVSLVQINPAKLATLKREILFDFSKPPLWDEFNWHCTPELHGDRLTARYVFVLDALNYCFWPESDVSGLEYEHLALGLRQALETKGERFENLEEITEARLASWLVAPHVFPLLETRLEAIRELGRQFKLHGDALEWIAQAQGSAKALVDLVAIRLSKFQDEGILNGKRICFYKRAQILVADVWAAFGQKTTRGVIGAFGDMGDLTIFADYRLPQLLREVGVLQYSCELAQLVDSKTELELFSREEVAIRACTVHAVELLKQLPGDKLMSVEIDWLLWQRGEQIKHEIHPNHRVRTIYY